MPTNLALDDELITQAQQLGRHRSKREAVNAALREYVQTRKRRQILSLAGKVEFWEDFDPKAMRRNKR